MVIQIRRVLGTVSTGREAFPETEQDLAGSSTVGSMRHDHFSLTLGISGDIEIMSGTLIGVKTLSNRGSMKRFCDFLKCVSKTNIPSVIPARNGTDMRHSRIRRVKITNLYDGIYNTYGLFRCIL